MQVIIHAGAHKTDEERLLKCLHKNTPMLGKAGVDVPPPRSYRKLFRDTLHAAKDVGLSLEAREVILDAVTTIEQPERLILSNAGFFGTPKMAVSAGRFYSAADIRMPVINEIFADDEVELFFALRNPASFLPAVFKDSRVNTFADFTHGADPRAMRWSEMFKRLRQALPRMGITVWCNEDTPLIWGEVIREMAGLDPTTPFDGEYMLLQEIMSKPGLQRFESYLEQNPGMSEMQKRRVIAAFLDKFAYEDEIEEEFDLPGWTEELIDDLTEAYDDDLYEIERIPGVTLITP